MWKDGIWDDKITIYAKRRGGCSIPFNVSMQTTLFSEKSWRVTVVLHRGRCCEPQRGHTGKLANFHQAG